MAAFIFQVIKGYFNKARVKDLLLIGFFSIIKLASNIFSRRAASLSSLAR
jgi:hypothetical protein